VLGGLEYTSPVGIEPYLDPIAWTKNVVHQTALSVAYRQKVIRPGYPDVWRP
jgi:hypothetical protein